MLVHFGRGFVGFKTTLSLVSGLHMGWLLAHNAVDLHGLHASQSQMRKTQNTVPRRRALSTAKTGLHPARMRHKTTEKARGSAAKRR
jgi:hypothetical protein